MKKKIKLNEYNSEIVGIKIKTLKNKEINIFSFMKTAILIKTSYNLH